MLKSLFIFVVGLFKSVCGLAPSLSGNLYLVLFSKEKSTVFAKYAFRVDTELTIGMQIVSQGV